MHILLSGHSCPRKGRLFHPELEKVIEFPLLYSSERIGEHLNCVVRFLLHINLNTLIDTLVLISTIFCVKNFSSFYSSPEPKAQVSLFIRCQSIRMSVNFCIFDFFPKPQANFNQTWHKASLSKVDPNIC